jgi:hypothetical protein
MCTYVRWLHNRVRPGLTVWLRLLAALLIAVGTLNAALLQRAHAAAPANCDHYIRSASWDPNGGYASAPYQHAEYLYVKPTRCGLSLAFLHMDDAWQEVQQKVQLLNGSSLRHQFECHTLALQPSVTPLNGKDYYDLEPWRPDETLALELADNCNPPPTDKVYGVGVGPGVSTATMGKIQTQLADSGGPPALGQPFFNVATVASGAYCYQPFQGGSRGDVGGANSIGAIVATNCAANGKAFWIGDYFMGYLESITSGLANELDVIGHPTSDSTNWGNGWRQDFTGGQRGSNILLRANSQTSAHDVYGPILNKYLSLGGAGGVAGFPLNDQYSCPSAGHNLTCQNFEHGVIETDGTAQGTTFKPGSGVSPPPASPVGEYVEFDGVGGAWSTFQITSYDSSTGNIAGSGAGITNSGVTFAITGNVSGTSWSMTWNESSGLIANFSGTLLPLAGLSGTWSQTDGQSGLWWGVSTSIGGCSPGGMTAPNPAPASLVGAYDVVDTSTTTGTYDFSFTIDTVDPSTGALTGHSIYKPNPSITETWTGTVSGSSLSLEGCQSTDYTAKESDTIGPDGSLFGIWYQNDGQMGTVAATRATVLR